MISNQQNYFNHTNNNAPMKGIHDQDNMKNMIPQNGHQSKKNLSVNDNIRHRRYNSTNNYDTDGGLVILKPL